MQMLLGRLGGPYCHANACSLCPFSKGEMLSVFFILFFFVSGPVSFAVFFAVLLFLGSFFQKKFSGANFCFWVGGAGLVFFGGFLPMFFLYFAGGSLPKVSGKNSLHVRSVFFGGALFFSLPPETGFLLMSRRFFLGSFSLP